jgi:hypothetical protein
VVVGVALAAQVCIGSEGQVAEAEVEVDAA